MKYPQLVSTRAVNAISDWLVSQLEQLGVEAPLIYSRLLLSLLHTSVQINDPIEFSNLETYLANRKGNKRNPPCDTDTLKKITAVQCLMETVSSEQEITKIENLVEELCEKLNDIENNQENNINELLVEDKKIDNSQRDQLSSSLPSSSSSSLSKLEQQRNQQKKLNEIEDPRKRYYRAFPALSKEMEDCVWLTKRNNKSLAWPTGNNSQQHRQIDQQNQQQRQQQQQQQQTHLSASAGAKVVETKLSSSSIIEAGSAPNVVNLLNNTAGVKRKTKRRRNQAMSKGKMGNYIRKNSYCTGNISPKSCWDTDFEGSWEMGRDLIEEFMLKQNGNRNRSTSESAAYNNSTKTIESSASVAAVINDYKSGNDSKRMKSMVIEKLDDICQDDNNNNNAKMMMTQNIDPDNLLSSYNDDLSTITAEMTISSVIATVTANAMNTDEGYLTNTDALTSLSEVDGSNSSIAVASLSSLNSSNVAVTADINPIQKDDTQNISSDSDFAQFKAKFNSSVEALWKNNDNGSNNNNNQTPNAAAAIDSIANIKNENLENFWANYYNHHYDDNKFGSDFDGASGGFSINVSSTTTTAEPVSNAFDSGIDETDFFSIPMNFGSSSVSQQQQQQQFMKKINAQNAFESNNNGMGVFLKNSIWSDSSSSYKDNNDEYGNVLGASFKDSKIHVNHYETDEMPYSFNLSKWSECSFEPPFIPSQATAAASSSTSSISSIDTTSVATAAVITSAMLRGDMLANQYLYKNYKQQPFASSNNKNIYKNSPSSSSSSFHHHDQQQQHKLKQQNYFFPQQNPSYSQTHHQQQSISASSSFCGDYGLINSTKSSTTSSVTLPPPSSPLSTSSSTSSLSLSSKSNTTISLVNHSTSSGFIEYSRIKSICNGSKFESKLIANNYQNMLSTLKHQKQQKLATSSSSKISSGKSSKAKNTYYKNKSGGNGGGAGGGGDSGGANADVETDDENLLTSERTHFCPIKQNYADGYEFDISGNLDEVNFERSESGYLWLESGTGKYLEYTRHDTFISDDEPSSIFSSITIPSSSRINIFNEQSLGAKKYNGKTTKFILKFRVNKINEKSCQTEDYIFWNKAVGSPVALTTAIKVNEQHSYTLLNTKKLMTQHKKSPSSMSSLSPFSYFVHCGNMKYLNTDSSCSSISDDISLSSSNYSYLKDDEASINLEQWTMAEIGKKCRQHNNNAIHTLWGMCPACNKDAKSIPANRLLKDELSLEGDEIMSDLKYMQDLYIGKNSGGGDDDGDGEQSGDEWHDDDNDSSNTNNDDDTDCDVEMFKECELYEGDSTADGCGGGVIGKRLIDSSKKQDYVYYDVRKFITDLFKPENAKSLSNITLETKTGDGVKICATKLTKNNSEEFTKNYNHSNLTNKCQNNSGLLWWNNDENVIWNQDLLLTKLRQNQHESSTAFLEKLNWKHSNLAKIWNEGNSSAMSNNNNDCIFNNKIEELAKIAAKHIPDSLLKMNEMTIWNQSSSESSTALFDKFNWKYSNLAEIWKMDTKKNKIEKNTAKNNSETNLHSDEISIWNQDNLLTQHQPQHDDSSTLLDKLNWEHSNLAEIWENDNKLNNSKIKEFTKIAVQHIPEICLSTAEMTIWRNQDYQNLQSNITTVNEFLNKLNWKHSNLSEIWEKDGQITKTDDNIINFSTEELTIVKRIAEKLKNESLKQLVSIATPSVILPTTSISSSSSSSSLSVTCSGRKRRHPTSSIISSSSAFHKNNLNFITENSKKSMETDNDKLEMMAVDDDDNLPQQKQHSTIITCKYWTTKATSPSSTSPPPMLSSCAKTPIQQQTTTPLKTFLSSAAFNYHNNNNNNSSSSSNDKFVNDYISNDLDGNIKILTAPLNPSSILKQVAVVTRPLTR